VVRQGGAGGGGDVYLDVGEAALQGEAQRLAVGDA